MVFIKLRNNLFVDLINFEAGVDFNSDDDLPHKIHMLNLFSKAKVILPPTRNQIDKAATSTCPLNPECLVLVAYLCNKKVVRGEKLEEPSIVFE
ncbi:hypothetical protein HS088_TW21G00571 [Tripterygium wilfordii]|uniref:Uncharacterized protein n=1 Tax=Tripterygium wilfordii TaxID=458696 RepID=A0A7J7C2P5_TRIWF|nr:hypothetical protein HS088_TW21G00571 [Tripterygium wilfordii]